MATKFKKFKIIRSLPEANKADLLYLLEEQRKIIARLNGPKLGNFEESEKESFKTEIEVLERVNQQLRDELAEGKKRDEELSELRKEIVRLKQPPKSCINHMGEEEFPVLQDILGSFYFIDSADNRRSMSDAMNEGYVFVYRQEGSSQEYEMNVCPARFGFSDSPWLMPKKIKKVRIC